MEVAATEEAEGAPLVGEGPPEEEGVEEVALPSSAFSYYRALIYVFLS